MFPNFKLLRKKIMVTKSIPVDNTIAPLLPPEELRSLCLCEYLIKRTFVLDITYLNESEEILCAALDKHEAMPAGYCAQNILSVNGEHTDYSTRLSVEAYLAPKAWYGSACRKNKNGKLSELMPGIPFEEKEPKEPHKVVVCFKMPKVMPRDEPLLHDGDKEILRELQQQNHDAMIAVHDHLLNNITVYRILDEKRLVEDIITSICVRISPDTFCYSININTLRVCKWDESLPREDNLYHAHKVLAKHLKFSMNTFLCFLTYYLVNLKDVESWVLFNEGKTYKPEGYGKSKLKKMAHTLLLFSKGEELLHNLLSTAFQMRQECRVMFLDYVKELAKALPSTEQEEEKVK